MYHFKEVVFCNNKNENNLGTDYLYIISMKVNFCGCVFQQMQPDMLSRQNRQKYVVRPLEFRLNGITMTSEWAR